MRVLHTSILSAFTLALSLAGRPGAARADSIPYPNPGTPNPSTYRFTAATTGDVIAYFAGSGAAYDEQLGLLDNGTLTSAGFGLDDHTSTIGQSFDFGAVTAGDTLVFVVDVLTPPLGDVYSDPTMNTAYDTNGSVGHNHIYSTPYTATSPIFSGAPVGTYIGFEDLPFPASDFNYTDETYVFTNVNTNGPSPILEPSSIGILAASLAGLSWLGRRRRGGIE